MGTTGLRTRPAPPARLVAQPFRLRVKRRRIVRLRSSSFGEASLKPWRKRAVALAEAVKGAKALVLICFVLVATVSTLSPPPARAAGQETADDGARLAVLQAETTLLEERVALASREGFHLFLDPSAAELKLMFGGAVLQNYPVAAIEVGTPRIAFVGISDPPPWQAVIWKNGRLMPPRPIEELEVHPAQAGVEDLPPPVIPPTVEEAIPVPMRYRIRFDGGLALEVVRQDAGAAGVPNAAAALGWPAGTWARLRAASYSRLRDITSMVRPSDRDAVRVRVVLDHSDAESLYRSLPPQPKLLIAYRR